MPESDRVKVTLSIDKKIWEDFQIYSIIHYHKSRHASKVIEGLMQKHLENQNYKSPTD